MNTSVVAYSLPSKTVVSPDGRAIAAERAAHPGSDVAWFRDAAGTVPAVLYTDATGATAAGSNVSQADSNGHLVANLMPGVYFAKLSTGEVLQCVVMPGVPAAPTLTSATAGSTQVTLALVPPTANGGSPLTGIEVWRGTAANGENTLVTTLAANATTFTDTGRAAGTPLFYKLKAVNALGSSAFSVEKTATPTA